MNFAGMAFVFQFLPVFLIIYYLIPDKYRNIVLFMGSIVFYSMGSGQYLILLLLEVIVNYLITDRFYDNAKSKKRLDYGRIMRLTVVLFCNILMLFYFKYMPVIMETMASANLVDTEWEALPLPLGISFFTFQMIAYDIDCYNGRYKKRVGFIQFCTFATMFPYYTSGPITRFDDVGEALRSRKITAASVEQGLSLFITGLSMKLLLADKLEALWNDIWRAGPQGIDTISAWIGAWGYSLELYFDFWGYSLMAVGLGLLLGFRLPNNFHEPYHALTMTSFWRKWHITLGKWFRDYIYIPLGGSRRGWLRTIINMGIVWLLTGLWHGAELHFIFWGVAMFLILVSEKLITGKFLERFKVIGHLYMYILIPVTWMIFKIADLNVLSDYLIRLVGIAPKGSVIQGFDKCLELISNYGILFVIGVFFATPYPIRWITKNINRWYMKLIFLCLFWICVYQMIIGGNNPFIYLRF